MVGLSAGALFSSLANAVNADGTIVVGQGYSDSGGYEASIWDAAHGTRSIKDLLTGAGLDLTDWSLDEATGVSADGLIVVGTGTHPSSGVTEAWIATMPIPEPTTLTLLAMGAMYMLGWAAHRHRLQKRGGVSQE